MFETSPNHHEACHEMFILESLKCSETNPIKTHGKKSEGSKKKTRKYGLNYSYNYITSITSPTKQMKVLSKKPWVCFPCFFLYHGKMVCIPWPTSRSKELKTKPRAWSLPPVPSKAPVLRDPRSSKPVAATTVPPWASSQLGTGEILKERGTV